MDAKFIKDKRLIVHLRKGKSFEGCVHSFNQDCGLLTLKEIVELSSRNEVTGIRRYFVNKDIERVDDLECTDIPTSTQKSSPSSIQIEDKNIMYNMLDDLPTFTNSVPDIQNLYQEIIPCSKLLEQISLPQASYRIIQNSTSNYYSAIDDLLGTKRVGVWAEEVTGKQIRISVLAMSTPTNIYLFDIATFGDNAFNKGLRGILESKEVLKIVYNCRFLSDCLQRKHLTRMCNVRDVEAEDIAVRFHLEGQRRVKTKSFSYLVNKYLGVKDMISLDKLQGSWSVRPLGKMNEEALVTAVSFLLPLEEAVQRVFLQTLHLASEAYNTSLRDRDITELPDYRSNNEHTLQEDVVNAMRIYWKRNKEN